MEHGSHRGFCAFFVFCSKKIWGIEELLLTLRTDWTITKFIIYAERIIQTTCNRY